MKSVVVKRSSSELRPEKPGQRVEFRRKVNPLSPPTTVELNGVTIHFPFRPYKCQEEYMTKVLTALSRCENALLESPTGTGKTLCLLCSTLAWQRSQHSKLMDKDYCQQGSQTVAAALDSQDGGSVSGTDLNGSGAPPSSKSNRVPTIIYASRTHSQLSQVVRELRNTRYRPVHAVLGSREQMCVHPKVKKPQSTASDINHDCNKLGKERKCRYRNQVEGFTPPSSETNDSGKNQPVLDMEDLIDMGKTHNVCPFYYTRSLVENAELILMPYNYLFDRDARETTLQDVPWNNAIIIFDEAHNLESFASDSASFDLSNKDIGGCSVEVQRAINALHLLPDQGYNLRGDNLLRLKAIFMKLEDYIISLPNNVTAYSGEYMMHILKQGAGIAHSNYEILVDEIKKVNDMIMDMKGTASTRGSPHLEHFVQCLKRVFGHRMEARCIAKASFYRVHVSPKQTGPNADGSRTVSYWCFAPALAMEELAGLKVRSILVTSGTLSPLPSYSMELGLPFPHTLENPHIIGSDQIHVQVFGKGVSGKLLTSSYERRKDEEYYVELGNTLAALARVVPAGMLVFFPSYAVMDTCLEKWGGPGRSSFGKNVKSDFFAQRQRKKNSSSNQYVFPQVPASYYRSSSSTSPWNSLLAIKSVVLEPRTSSDLPDAIAQFRKFLELPKSPGCVLMGVCRGKISEGIDFSNDMSRAVVITGIPFAPSMDAKVKLKRNFLDSARANANVQASNDGGFGSVLPPKTSLKLSGNDWYTQQAHRAVNQAVGRVIRSRTDYGAILLLDSRFEESRNQVGLSKWIQPYVQNDKGFQTNVQELERFFKNIQTRSFEVTYVEEPPLPFPKSEESADENLSNSKVAFIKPPKGINQQSGDTEEVTTISRSYVHPDQVIAMVSASSLTVKCDPPPSATVVVKRDEGKQAFSFDGAFENEEKPQKHSEKQKSSKDEAATRFMEGTRSLSLPDQTKVRKAIVLMKKSSDERDLVSYRASAHEVMQVLISHERIEEPPKPDDPRLLFIFFDLLPPAYRQDTEKVALRLIFEKSSFGELIKKYVSPYDYSKMRSKFLLLMSKTWRIDKHVHGVDRDVLRDVQEVVVLLSKCDKGQSSTLCAALVRMIPPFLQEHTRALIDEMNAKRNMEIMKQHDKSNIGPDAIDKRLFASILPNYPVSRDLPSTAPPVAGSRIDGTTAPASSAGDLSNPNQLVLTNKHNPYLAKTRAEPVPSQPFTTADDYSRKKPKLAEPSSITKTINPYARKKQPPQSNDQQKADIPSINPSVTTTAVGPTENTSSLQTILKTIGSDPFVKQSKNTGTIRASNAPSSMSCTICESGIDELFLATCGHLACLDCWNQWLSKSQSCPVCRAPCSRDALARAIFRGVGNTSDEKLLS